MSSASEHPAETPAIPASPPPEVAAPLDMPHENATPPAVDDFEDYEELTPELVEDEAIRGDFVLRWSVVLMAFLFGATCIAESATLVHVASGRYLWSHGVWPPANDYLPTPPSTVVGQSRLGF